MFSHHNMKNEYISLTVDNLGRIDFTQPLLQRRSLWRVWMSLSRLQKNLIRFITLALILSIWLSISYSKSQPHKRKPLSFNNAQANENEPLQAPHREDSFQGDDEDDRSNQLDDTNLVDTNPNQEVQNKLEKPNNNLEPKLPEPIPFPKPSNARQRAVVDAFKHAWSSYKKYAWGQDMLKPISKSAHKWFGLGLTLVDSLDTLWIMGLHDEFNEASNWVRDEFRLSLETSTADVNLFEVTIRVLGGLLSAYHFSANDLFVSKALDIGEALLPCFEKSPSGIPYSDVNLASHIPHAPKWSPDSSTAEVTTLQLEFRDLTRVTKLKKFEDASSRVSELVHSLDKMDGLVPIYINPFTGKFKDNSEIKLGARGDSYYEYLLKQWIQTGKTKQFLKDDYLESVAGIQKHLVRRTPNRNLLFVGELGAGPREHKKFNPKMDHLVCFLPGTLALGHHHGMPESHLTLAHQLLDTCYYMYADQPTFLSPEIAYFNTEGADLIVHNNDAHYLLRPEFLESLFVLHQLTGNATYQEWGWKIFQSIEKYCKTPHGYTSIGNVLDERNVRPLDSMESFFLSETLKYLYLLLSNDRKLLDLDKYVLNSEAQPLPILNNYRDK
uniref:alpha-1,2-Mannosidase n=1 Tax=Cacopsylla melanoneura TaxID=428564 RepID=A0A8D8YM95_9HEMI